MQHSRRHALQVAAGGAVALTAGAIASDPIFALIESHRRATALHSAALREQERCEQAGIDDNGVSEAACHADMGAWREFVNTPPHTLAGLKAWASYLDEVRKDESWKLEDEAEAIVQTLAKAITQCV